MQLLPQHLAALGEPGYAVVDDLLSADEVRACARAARALADEGAFAAAGVRRGGDHRLDEAVRSDRIAWLDPAGAGPWAAVFERLEQLRTQLNREVYLGLRRTEVQLGWYPGGGSHYDAHLDAFPGSDNRRLSVVLYLNEAWRPEHGGQLRLHVAPPLDVAPLGGRAVLFRSELIEHEVLPVYADRFAVAAWFSA